MKKRSLVVVALAAAAFFPAGSALAQNLPDVPGIGPAASQVNQTPRTPRAAAGSTRVGNGLPGTRALPDLRAPATRSPNRLPATGVNTTSLALDGLTLLGAGSLLLAVRRRLSHS
jgi:LPXTG-motif cell wall-anchored protein